MNGPEDKGVEPRSGDGSDETLRGAVQASDEEVAEPQASAIPSRVKTDE